jgi:hypothetical protein
MFLEHSTYLDVYLRVYVVDLNTQQLRLCNFNLLHQSE